MVNEFKNNIAVIIGIDEYTNSIPKLSSAVNDAQRLATILQSEHDYHVKLLTNQDANLKSLSQTIEEWLPDNITEDDRVLFYFAGHGVATDADDGPRGYLLPQDASRTDITTYIEMSQLHDKLMLLPCRHMLIILDSCFAGAFRWSSNRDLIVQPSVVHQEAYQRFIQDPAWQLITSAAHDQVAADQLVNTQWGNRGEQDSHSPFALALFEALSGAADIVPEGGDGVITATELYVYLESTLFHQTAQLRSRQTPGLWPLKRHNKGEYIFNVPGRKINLPPAPTLNLANNPYRGLHAYEVEHTNLFFGRDKSIKDLCSLIQSKQFVAVIGASGSGKSSLVKAGILPQLQEHAWLLHNILRPGLHPLPRLQRLKTVIQQTKQKQLLVIDQFEELITMTREDTERKEVFTLLVDLLQTFKTLHVIVTIRADFEAHFQTSQLKTYWQSGRFIIPPLEREDFRQIIEQPASEKVLYFEPTSLIERMIDDVVTMPGALPLLSFTLSEMYMQYLAAKRGDRALNQSDYENLGGAAGALRTRADKEYHALDEAHKSTLQQLMLRMMLIEHGLPVRQRIIGSTLKHWDPTENQRIENVVTRLCDARLLVKGVDESGQHYVEPAHDALISSWTKLLGWSRKAQQNEPDLHFLHTLSESAQSWYEAPQDIQPGLLWRDKTRSQRLWSLRKHNRILLNQLEDTFCQLSIRRQRIIRGISALAVVLILLFAIIASGFGLVVNSQRDALVDQISEVQKQSNKANSNAMSGAALVALDGQNNPTVGLNLALEALTLDPQNSQAHWLVRRAVYRDGIKRFGNGYFSAPMYRTLAYDAYKAIWSPDSQHFAIINNEFEKVTIYRANGSLRSTRTDGFTGVENFSSDGQRFIDQSGNAYNLNGVYLPNDFVDELPKHQDASTLLMSDEGNTAWYHAFNANKQIRAGHGALAKTLDLSGTQIAPFEVTKDNQVMNTIPGEWSLPVLSNRGDLLATANFEGDLAIWRIQNTGGPAKRLFTLNTTSSTTYVHDMAFSPDAGSLLTIMSDGELRLWYLQWNPVWVKPDVLTESIANSKTTNSTRFDIAIDDSGSTADTPFFKVAVNDNQTSNQWSVDLTASSLFAKATDDIVYIVQDGIINLYDPLGVRRLAFDIPLTGIEAHDINAIDEHLILSADLVLPIDTSAIVARAKKNGLIGFSERDRAKWLSENLILREYSLTNNTNQQQEPTLITRLGQQLADMLWPMEIPKEAPKTDNIFNTEQTNLDVSPSSIPLIWQHIAIANTPDNSGFYDLETPGNVRWYLTNVNRAGIPNLLASANVPAPFLSGPHSLQSWVVWGASSEEFGHYNPAFLTWLEINLIPSNKNSPMRFATQTIYDRAIRDMLRVHAIALHILQSNPSLQAEVLKQYETYQGSHSEYILEKFTNIALAASHRKEAKPRDFAFAMGFWIRRDLDGTKTQFTKLMNKTLEMYDETFLVDLQMDKF